MSRLTDDNVALAREIIARYPKKKSALIPLVHLSQEQNGYVTEDAMRHVAELIDVTPAEVYGTATSTRCSGSSRPASTSSTCAARCRAR